MTTEPTVPDTPEDKLKKAAEQLGKVAEKLGPASELLEKGAEALRDSTPRPGAPEKPKPPTEEEKAAARKPYVWNMPSEARAAPPAPQPPPNPSAPSPPPSPTRKRKPPKGKLGKLWSAVRPTLARQFNKSRLGRFAKNVSWYGKKGEKLGGRVGRALGGKALAGSGAAIGAVAGKAIPIVGAAVAAAGALNDFRKYVQQAADSALEAHRKYAEISGAQAAIFAESDMKQMLRDLKTGEKTAGTTKELADSVNDRKDMFQPLEVAIDNLTNTVLANLQNLFNEFMEPLVELATTVTETVNDIYKCLPWASAKPEKKKEEFGTLEDIKGAIFEDAAAAQARARDAMERARDAARGLRPGG